MGFGREDRRRAVTEAEQHLHEQWHNASPTIPMRRGGEWKWFPWAMATGFGALGAAGGVFTSPLIDSILFGGWQWQHFGQFGTAIIDGLAIGGTAATSMYFIARSINNLSNRNTPYR